MNSIFKLPLLLFALLFCTNLKAQQYDTISFPHSYIHEAHILLLNGKLFKGPLVDTKDGSVVFSASNHGDSIFEFRADQIQLIKVFRSNFERRSTSKLIVLGSGALGFFSTLNYLGNRREDLRFKNSEWLISGIATLVVMPIAALLSDAAYLAPREEYVIEGKIENFRKNQAELKAYSFWTYLTSKNQW